MMLTMRCLVSERETKNAMLTDHGDNVEHSRKQRSRWKTEGVLDITKVELEHGNFRRTELSLTKKTNKKAPKQKRITI